MKRVLVLLMVVCGLSVAAFGTPLDALTALLDKDCITGADAATFFTQIMTCCPGLAEIEDCVTIEQLSLCLFDALDLSGTFLEMLFGYSSAEKIRIAQRECVMVVGVASDKITGYDMAAIATGVSRYLLRVYRRPECFILNATQIKALMASAQALLPPGVLAQLLPCAGADYAPTS